MEKEKNSSMYTGMLVVVAFVWGSGFVATQIAFDAGYSSFFMMCLRFLLGATLFGLVFRRSIFPLPKKEVLGGFACGVLLFSSFMLQTLGLQSSTPSSNAFLTATNIVIVPLITWVLYKKRPTAKVFIGALLCFLGVWILSFSGEGMGSFGKGEILTLLGAVCFALHTTCLGHFAKQQDTKRLNFLQLLFAAVLSCGVFLLFDRNFTQFIPRIDLLSVVYLAVFSTCIAYFLQTTAQKHVHPSKVAVIISTESLFASILSVILGYDMLQRNLVIGGLFILISVIIVEVHFKPKRRITLDEKSV